MPGRNFLFIPGPAHVSRHIQNAMNIEQEYLRNGKQDRLA